MNICVFDTETTSLDKPFCYNIGYMIIDTDNWSTLVEREFVVEQTWHNEMLYTTAYYASKRSFYVAEMRKRTIKMDKFGYICQQMIRDFKAYEVNNAFAYNSSFDERVFNFNCDWFKCNNPFDDVDIKDIRGFAHNFLIDRDYLEFCEKNSYFTDSGNYSTTAETIYRYITRNNDFVEAHTALDDSRIESAILETCVSFGANLEVNYQASRSIERKVEKTLHLVTAEQTDYYFDYNKMRISKDKQKIVLS